MASAIAKYHHHFLPKGGFFAKEMGALRRKRAGEIKALRSQVGRKKAKATILVQYKTHVSAVNAQRKAAKRTTKIQAVREKSRANMTRSPRWRRRGGGKVKVISMKAVPKCVSNECQEP